MLAILGLHNNSIIWNNSSIASRHKELLGAAVVAKVWENIKNDRQRAIERKKGLAEC